MTIAEMLDKYRQDRQMSELQWKQYCKRYASHRTDTVVWALGVLYGTLPPNIDKLIQIEMKKYLETAH